MPLSRSSGRGRTDAPPASQGADAPSVEPGAGEPETDLESEPEPATHAAWHERAERILPPGASTGSKRAASLYGDVAADLPTHFASARGAVLTDADGIEYLDCTMALGAVALGYREPRVTEAVVQAATQGNVSALSSWREVELAERLQAIIPGEERVLFMKTGAEAGAAAVRVARTYPAREQVIACGYFGWHDWCSDSAGVPASVRRTVDWVPFDEIGALDLAAAAAASSLAAIVLEPVIEHLPSVEWLQRAREICDATGAALIFDEVKTGFRVAPGGYQEVSGVTPDLAVFGKALANGYPLAALAGNEALMSAPAETWTSPTLASESTALAAALAVLDWHEEADICATLAETGREMRAAVDRAIAASGVEGVTTEGIDPMWLMRWSDPALESFFVAEPARNGVRFKRCAYNFAPVAHDDAARRDIEAAASAALVAVREHS